MKRHGELALSALIVLVALPVHLTGLLVPEIYRDPAVLVPQNLGTDLVTLCVVIPLFAIAAIIMQRGSQRARLLWLGCLGYLVYAYGMFALGVHWNPLFLAYLTVFGLSFFTLTIGLIRTDAVRIRDSAAGRAPVRSVAAYLIAIAAIVSGLWLSEEVAALAHGTVPPSVLQAEAPTNIVHVFDLAIVLPAFVLAAVMLLRDRPWGYVLAGALLIKASAIGLWVAAMIWFSARQGFTTPRAITAFFVVLPLCGMVLIWAFLARIDTKGVGQREYATSGAPSMTGDQ